MAKKPAYRAGRDQAATAENVELLTGQRGDRLDKAVTFRELAALGLSTLRPGAGGIYVPGKNPDLFPPGQMEFPHAPVNVIANGAFHTVLVEWDPPQYRGHAHAEIWRAESDNQAEATLLGTSSANLFSDAIGKGAKFYYWVRFVNGKDDKGPFQGMQGVEAETSRDVQDILDELEGKIEESHLAQALLRPIEQVPQLQLDIAILKPKVDEIEVMRPKVNEIDLILHKVDEIEVILPKIDEIEVIRPKIAAIEGKIPGIEQELAGLDERQKVAQELLDDAQQQLGMSSIELGLVQDRLNAKLDKYKGDFDSFRDAVFVIDPENGSMTMDAVNAVREEMRASITEVHLGLDAVAGQIDSKADNVTVDSQGSRLTEAEQRINGLDASLSQTVTKGEFTDEQQRVTQIGQELNATKGELTQKAAQQEVDEHGQRLANAESKLTVHAEALSTQAQRIDGLQATVSSSSGELDARITELARVTADANGATAQRIDGLQATVSSSGEELDAKITELARVTADADGVAAQRVSGLEVRASKAEGKILALEEVIESEGGITAGRFDEIQAEIELAKDKAEGALDVGQAAIDAALAGDERDRGNRSAFGSIRTQQQVIVDEQSAQAKRITDMNVKFEGRDANTQARISGVEVVLADTSGALAQRIDNLSASTDTALDETTATIKALEKVSSDADAALALRQDQMRVEMTEADNTLSADIASESEARVTADEAISRRVSEVEAQFSSDLEDAKARVAAEELARATKDEALAQQISTVDAAFKAADTALSASLAESSKAMADADRALGERISTLDVTVGENSASITELQQAVVSNEASLSQRQDKMESEIVVGAASLVEGALAGDERDRENRKARGVILQQQSTLANQQEAQARTVEQLTAEFDAETADLKAQITNEQLVRATADEALSQRISVVDAEFKAANADTNAVISALEQSNASANEALSLRQNQLAAALSDATAELVANITQEESARVTADEAISRRVAEVEAQFSSDLADTNARVAAEELARATKDEALAQQISTVDAAFKAADTALSASLAESSKAMADADRALGERISTLDVTVGENSASITELQQAVVSNEASLSQRQDKMESEIVVGAVSQVEGALAGDERDRENRKARGVILQQQSTLANQQEAQARTVEQLTAEFDAENGEIRAQITNEQLVRATADEALSQRISVVDSEFKAADAATNAAVAAEVRARSDADSALAEQLSTLDTEFKGAEHALAASIDEVSRVSAEANQSLSEQLSQVKATAESAGTAAAGAQISANQAKEDAAAAAGIANGKGKVLIQSAAPAVADRLAQNLWIDTTSGINTPKRWSGSAWVAVTDKVAIDAAQAAAAAQASADQAAQGVARNTAAINDEVKARADADSAMAQQIQQVTANYQQGDQQLQGQITAESVARADAMQALGSQIDTVSAVAGSKNKTFFQATAPGSAMGTGDLWFDTANNNRPYRYSGTAWVATDDPRIAANAAAVQLQSQAIADLQNGAQAMWTAKASAGQITAGIGLVAKSDGTSQVAISASQVFVFNPNSSTPMAPLFAIDNGQAVIAEAIIRKATIQILTSEKITADYIKAGVSMSAPAISGGSIDMGNAFLSGGAAGFGKGGPYGGWSWTWHTIIYADGSLYTDRLFASNGSFTGTVNANAGTFQNVTIEETCNVKGTVYANKIVGDVLSAKVVSANSTDSAGSGHVVASASVKGSRTHAANLYCLGVTVEVYASGGYQSGGNDQDVPATISGRLVLRNTAGSIVASAPFKVSSRSNSSVDAAGQSVTIQGGFDAGTGTASISVAVIIDSQSASYGGSAGVRVPAQHIAFCLLPSGSQFN
ncbi:phage tail tip fiber protein [Aeromonas caviae]